MKLIIIVAVTGCATLALACGSAPENEWIIDYDLTMEPEPDPAVDTETDPSELVQLGQPMSAPVTPTFQIGTRTSSSRMRCDRSTSGQVCQIPPTKSIAWCGGAPLPYSADLQPVVDIFDAVSGWTYTFGNTSCSSFFNIKVQTQADGCGSNGTGSNNINDYVCTTFNNTTSLTEGSGVVGQYQRSDNCTVKIDDQQITAKVSDADGRRRLFRHAWAHGLAECVGLGGRNSVASNHATRVDINSSVERTSLTSGEVCTLQNYSTSSNTTFSNSGTCASD